MKSSFASCSRLGKTVSSSNGCRVSSKKDSGMPLVSSAVAPAMDLPSPSTTFKDSWTGVKQWLRESDNGPGGQSG